MKAPIHHTTSASILTESCSSGRSASRWNLTAIVPTTAPTSKRKPTVERESPKDSDRFHSRYINETLTGRMSNMCVYWLSRTARAKVEVRGLLQTSKEIAARTENSNGGDNLRVDSRVEPVSTMEMLCPQIRKLLSASAAEIPLRLQLRKLLPGIFSVAGTGVEFQRLLQLLSGECRLSAFRIGHSEVIVKSGIVG